jgi:hypothetical protein
MVALGEAGQREAGMARSGTGTAWLGGVAHGIAGIARRGWAWEGRAGRGWARQREAGKARLGRA